MALSRGETKIEVIEELLPLVNIEISVKLPGIKRVSLEPQGEALAFRVDGDTISLKIDSFTCHQMIVLHKE